MEEIRRAGNEIVSCTLAGLEIDFLVDSGSPINTVTVDVYQRLKAINANLWDIRTQCDRQFTSFADTTPLKVITAFQGELKVKETNQECSAQFFVIENSKVCLICKNTGERLNILKVGVEICVIHKDTQEAFPAIPIAPVHLYIDENVQPVKNLYCRIPVAMRDKVIQKLQWMLEMKIIEKVNEPASWISPMVVVPKGNDDVRICIDMRQANKAIQRVNHVMPCLETLRDKLCGCKVFSKLDITLAYHHITLHKDSRHVTTFMSPLGLLRYTRLVFGINCAPEIFQKIMDEIFADFPQLVIYLDDILLATPDKASHDKILTKLMERLKELNFKLNESKCQFKADKVDFMGFAVTSRGLEMSQKKIEAVTNCKAPTNITELRSFLGLTNFISHFIEDYATKTFPLRKLLKNPFVWTEE